jgi:hypothetical protein
LDGSVFFIIHRRGRFSEFDYRVQHSLIFTSPGLDLHARVWAGIKQQPVIAWSRRVVSDLSGIPGDGGFPGHYL